MQTCTHHYRREGRMVYKRTWLPFAIFKTRQQRRAIRTSMLPTQYLGCWTYPMMRLRRGRLKSLCGSCKATSKTCYGRGTLWLCFCYTCGIAKQVAVYGGSNSEQKWKVHLSVCTCDCTITKMLLYKHSFREELSLTSGISHLWGGSRDQLECTNG